MNKFNRVARAILEKKYRGEHDQAHYQSLFEQMCGFGSEEEIIRDLRHMTSGTQDMILDLVDNPSVPEYWENLAYWVGHDPNAEDWITTALRSGLDYHENEAHSLIGAAMGFYRSFVIDQIIQLIREFKEPK